MNKLTFLLDQIDETRLLTKRLMAEIPEELWFTIPENTNSNFAWQIGHILVAQNFHAITSITGFNRKIAARIPIMRYNRIFNGMGTLHRSVKEEIVSVKLLKEQLAIVHDMCLHSMAILSEDVLKHPLEPLPFKHPVAKTKYDALSWCFKHEMWHCAEMEDIKRRLEYSIVWIE